MRFVPSFPFGSLVTEGTLRGGCRPTVAGKDLPPLPDIRKENIRLQVFTHRSFYARQTRLFEDHPGRDGCYVNAPTKTSRLSDNA